MSGKRATTVAVVLTLAVSAALGDLQGSPDGLAGTAAAAPLVDVYIRGVVTGRVPGRNAATVDIRWDFKCLGDRLGAATYSWTLKLVRRLPRPEHTRTLLTGTSKTGRTRVQLSPGRYEPVANPFRCETDRGAGSTDPEVGQAFVVPDYCAWTAAAPRGTVRLEQAGAVKPLANGDAVRQGDTVVTAGRSSVVLRSRGGKSSLRLSTGSRITVDRRHCGRRGGWKIIVSSGLVSGRLAESDVKRPYQIVSGNAITDARRASWTVEARARGGAPWTRVRVQSGQVTVTVPRRRARGTVTLRAGYATVVAGSRSPTRPRR